MQFTGRVRTAYELQSGIGKTGKEWRTASFLIEEEGQRFNQSIVVEQRGDFISKQPLVVGRLVTVYFDISAREYNGKGFNTLNCWKVENLDNGGYQQPQQQYQQQYQQPPQQQYQQQPPQQQQYQEPYAQQAEAWGQAPQQQQQQGGTDNPPF